jgi:hypothetical protein
MLIKQVGEETMHLEPKTEDESRLVQMLFERITLLRPDDKLGDRADEAMSLFTVVKQWAHDGASVKTINE